MEWNTILSGKQREKIYEYHALDKYTVFIYIYFFKPFRNHREHSSSQGTLFDTWEHSDEGRTKGKACEVL